MLTAGYSVMMRLSIAAIAFAAFGIATPASAFHPFDETYGYVMPEKFKKYQKAEKPEPAPLFGFKPSVAVTSKSKSDAQIGDAKKVAQKGPADMDGGGTPSIAPVAPPKVSFPNSYGAGAVVIDTAGRRLYYVLSSSTAYKYPIAVGREGFTWTGTEKIAKKVAWPDWNPPAEMLERKPELPEHMSGGIRNPLGAMALYLGNSLYRIHGTNDAKSIGTAASSGCIRMTNGHVTHLASLVGVGTTVHVLSKLPSNIAKAAKAGNDG
jgi:lipoprotein-anchoring transpeptidase ErfK/SrfK